MSSKTWKNNELAIAKAFGTRRNPFSGSMSHQSQSDTLHDRFYIEVKDGKQSTPSRLWLDTVRKAKMEGKVPMVIKHGKREKLMDARVTLRLGDFLELVGLKGEAEATMNTPENGRAKTNSKSVINKNRKEKHGIHTEKKKNPEKNKAMEA